MIFFDLRRFVHQTINFVDCIFYADYKIRESNWVLNKKYSVYYVKIENIGKIFQRVLVNIAMKYLTE